MIPDRRIFLFAGEQSGDSLGARLMESLRKKDPLVAFEGVGGPSMRRVGMEQLIPMEDFQVMGFTDVIFAYPRLRKRFFTIRDHILNTNPDVVVLIDYPGFNLRMARALRDNGYHGKLVHYVAPTVWAHSPDRARQLIETVDLLLIIYPFEQRLFEGTSLRCRFVGNPIIDCIRRYQYTDDWRITRGIGNDRSIVSIFPGSRPGEIDRNLPLQLEPARRLLAKHPEIQLIVSVARPELQPVIEKLVHDAGLQDVKYCDAGEGYDLMRHTRLALATSGTVNRELALHRVPTVVTYQPNLVTAVWARMWLGLKLNYYCMVNIVADKQIFPEHISLKPSVDLIAVDAERLFTDGPDRDSCLRGCDEANALFSDHSASDTAANEVLELVQSAPAGLQA